MQILARSLSTCAYSGLFTSSNSRACVSVTAPTCGVVEGGKSGSVCQSSWRTQYVAKLPAPPL